MLGNNVFDNIRLGYSWPRTLSCRDCCSHQKEADYLVGKLSLSLHVITPFLSPLSCCVNSQSVPGSLQPHYHHTNTPSHTKSLVLGRGGDFGNEETGLSDCPSVVGARGEEKEPLSLIIVCYVGEVAVSLMER